MQLRPIDDSDHLKSAANTIASISFHGHKTIWSGEQLAIGLSPLCTAVPKVELIQGTAPLTRFTSGPYSYTANGEVLFFCGVWPETGDLEKLAESAYMDLLETTKNKGYPYLLRIWHYLDSIHGQTKAGSNRYQAFCAGRARAILAHQLPENGLPAASMLGGDKPGLCIYGFAAQSPGQQIENPRQISAFRYPDQYGPASPAFSRAIYKRWGKEAHLYISGTASITGHRSQHEKVGPQLDETLANIETIFLAANKQAGFPLLELNQLEAIKVYLRSSKDLSPIRTKLERTIPDVPTIYLRADVCRPELLIEIEGWARVEAGQKAKP